MSAFATSKRSNNGQWAKRETMRVVTLGLRNPMVIFYVRSIDVVPREMILILPDIISLYYRMLA